MLFVIAIISLIIAAVVINVLESIDFPFIPSLVIDFIKGTHINRCCIIDSVF